MGWGRKPEGQRLALEILHNRIKSYAEEQELFISWSGLLCCQIFQYGKRLLHTAENIRITGTILVHLLTLV